MKRSVCTGLLVLGVIFSVKSVPVFAAESLATVAIVADDSGYYISGNAQGQPAEDFIETEYNVSSKYEIEQDTYFSLSDIFLMLRGIL